LTSDQTREVVFAWPSFPVDIHFEKNSEDDLGELLEAVVSEISNIAGRKIVSYASRDLAKIHIIFSKDDWKMFYAYYGDFFKYTYGEEEFNYWREKGAFDFPIADEHPCFGFGITSPDKFSRAGYTRLNTPDFFLIGILESSTQSRSDYMACLREELAHALFFIPDYKVNDWQESIFNSNATTPELMEFSNFDKDLIRFLANTSLRHVHYGQLGNLVRGFSGDEPKAPNDPPG
jgi:hypothetical protein